MLLIHQPLTKLLFDQETGNLNIFFNLSGENANEVMVNIYRNGELVAKDEKVSRNDNCWQDKNTNAISSPSYYYTLESFYISSGTISQRAKPVCYWGANYERVYSVSATKFKAVGGNFSNNHGKPHFENWGNEPNDCLTVNITSKFSGSHGIQVVAGNGSGSD